MSASRKRVLSGLLKILDQTEKGTKRNDVAVDPELDKIAKISLKVLDRLDLEEKARKYNSIGKYQEAAALYIRLAESVPEKKDLYLQLAQEANSLLGYSN